MALVQGLSQSEIARQLGRDRGTIASVLRAEDTQTLKARIEDGQADEALRVLRRNVAKVAGNWVEASLNAATRGDHRPARDLLLHTRVIDPVDGDRRSGPTVQIVLNGGSPPLELSPAITVSGHVSSSPELPAAVEPSEGAGGPAQ